MSQPFYSDARRAAMPNSYGTGFVMGVQILYCLLVATVAFFVSGGGEAGSAFHAGDVLSPLTLTGHTLGAVLAAAVVSAAFWFVIVLNATTRLFNDALRSDAPVPTRAPTVSMIVTTALAFVIACVPGPHTLMWLAVGASIVSVLWSLKRAKRAERRAAV